MGYATAMWLGFGEALAAHDEPGRRRDQHVAVPRQGDRIALLDSMGHAEGIALRRRPKVKLCAGAGLEPGAPSARPRVT